jgi:hypothetical protein
LSQPAGARRWSGGDASAVSIESAGTSATAGQPASEGSRRVAEAEGLDLSGHRSRAVTPDMLRRADLVLVMSPSHRTAVLAMGASIERVHVVNEWPPPGPGLAVFDLSGASYAWRGVLACVHARRIAPHVRYARLATGDRDEVLSHPVRAAAMAMTKSEKIWMNGQFVAWDDAKVHVLSHVLHYGSSVFEGIRCCNTSRAQPSSGSASTSSGSRTPRRSTA